MTFVTGTGAFWLDVTLMGFGSTTLLLLTYAVILTHPGIAVDSGWMAISYAFAVFGGWLAVVGVWLGKRTHWAIPDPKVAKTK